MRIQRIGDPELRRFTWLMLFSSAPRVVFALVGLAACQGTIGGPMPSDQASGGGVGGVPSSSGGNNGSPLGPEATWCQGSPVSVAGQQPFRRLSKREYNNAIASLFGSNDRPADRFVADERLDPFVSNANASPSDALVGAVQEAAEELAAKHIDSLVSQLQCGTGVEAELRCGQRFISEFGQRVYRRPLQPGELAAYQRLFVETRTADGFKLALAHVVQTLLQSPHFLYHVETYEDADPQTHLARLTPFSLASRLAFLITGGPPDQVLRQAAQNGQLETAHQLRLQAERLLDTVQAQATMLDFYQHWFELERLAIATVDPIKNPGFDSDMRKEMDDQATAFVSHVLSNGARLTDLLTAPFTIDAKGQQVAKGPAKPVGVLTQPALLTVNPRSVQRGRMVRQLMLCQTVPAPPPDVEAVLPARVPGESARQQWQRHVSSPACGGCHKLMDPIGFAFEHYDELGQWRDKDEGFDIDDEAEITDAGDATGVYQGVAELGAGLAASQEVQRCVTQQWLRYGLGRELADGELCAVKAAIDEFSSKQLDTRALLAALVTTTPFTHVLMTLKGP